MVTHTHTHTHTYRCVLESTYAFELGAELAEDARLQVCRGNRFVCSALALGDFDALRLRTLLNRSAASYMVPSLSPSCLLSHNTPYFLSCLIQDRAFPRSPVSFAVFAFSTLVGTTTGSRAKLEPSTWVRCKALGCDALQLNPKITACLQARVFCLCGIGLACLWDSPLFVGEYPTLVSGTSATFEGERSFLQRFR